MTKELEVAIKAAKEAGEILKTRFQGFNPTSLKADESLVTESDKLSEQKVISIIKKNFPYHSIRAEESGFSDEKSESTWVIDPLDGTTNYARKVPIFSVSIALMERDRLKLGLVYDPVHDQLFSTEKNMGTKLNNQRVQVSDITDLGKTMVGYARPSVHKGEFANIFSRVEQVTRTPKILGSMALQLAYVAAGILDATVLLKPSSWDAAAGTLLVQEAGGKVTDLQGNPWSLDSKDILATNGKIHKEILEIINR
ncbi:MAG: hypothetical protein A2Y57_01875 [Candidatus Woykebacteria bacterium RBG_13_40_7b]|uniref:Inositol-1-monophosphatase n=1 Tax=Candidatus Woykebacteria bacterium RBG_13_40_7b TaxID=1802594 RepID=A0A1G1WA99_9BACT|nr:MAG: hypothetical protein A2Y57_01875 [Candidatus Woykebacteria bacterium RBG_13_40_7b]